MLAVTGPVIQQPVGMPRRGHELNAEAPYVPGRRAEHIAVGLTGIASAGGNLSELQGAGKKSGRDVIPSWSWIGGPVCDDQACAHGRGQAVVAAETDCPLRTGALAGAAKKAPADIQRQGAGLGADRHGAGGAGGLARGAIRLADGGDRRLSGETLRQLRRRTVRVGQGAIFLFKSSLDNF